LGDRHKNPTARQPARRISRAVKEDVMPRAPSSTTGRRPRVFGAAQLERLAPVKMGDGSVE
jgi:hypothetical protein